MIIEVNTDELVSAVNIASQATQSLTDAMELLNSIVVHNNWFCAERHVINDNTIHNRKSIQNLQSNAMSMYQAVQFTSSRFNDLQHEIGVSFEMVDGPLGSFLSLIPSGGMLGKSSTFSSSTLGNIGDFLRKSAICSFGSISSALNGK